MRFYTFYNGNEYGKTDVFIPLSDRCVFFGDGIYDACVCRNGKVFMLNEHIERFVTNAGKTEIPLNYTVTELSEIISAAARKTKSTAFIYFQLTRFSEERQHAAGDTVRSNFLLTASDLSLHSPEHTLNLIKYEDTRHLICDIKTLNLMVACAASREAQRRGADEAVFVRNGTVTECAHSNLHIIKNGTVFTHPLDRHILPGISRYHLLKTAKKLNIPCRETPFGERELKDADEVLVTSTSKICLRAKRYEETEYDTEKESIGLSLCRRMREDFNFFTK